jgi:MazG family protein
MTTRFEKFVSLVERLRRECPWDRSQTHESMRESLIEEAYEVVDAIDRSDADDLKGELGDVLLNVVFHSVLANESGSFNIDDVLESETVKLVARHPHVFGEEKAEEQETVLKNWERIKREEEGRESVLDGVPSALPALQFAQRVQSKAARVGFDFATADDAWEKVTEELHEIEQVGPTGDEEDLASEIGDLLFAVVNYARLRGISAEMVLRQTNAKFNRRFRHIEKELDRLGRSPDTSTLEEMDALWEESKRAEDR